MEDSQLLTDPRIELETAGSRSACASSATAVFYVVTFVHNYSYKIFLVGVETSGDRIIGN